MEQHTLTFWSIQRLFSLKAWSSLTTAVYIFGYLYIPVEASRSRHTIFLLITFFCHIYLWNFNLGIIMSCQVFWEWPKLHFKANRTSEIWIVDFKPCVLLFSTISNVTHISWPQTRFCWAGGHVSQWIKCDIKTTYWPYSDEWNASK